MTRLLAGAIALLMLSTAVLGFLWHREGKATAKAQAAVTEAVNANEALLASIHAWQEAADERDALLAENRNRLHEINRENARLQASLRNATRGDVCANTDAPDDVIRLLQGGDQGRAGGGVPAEKPNAADPGA